MSDTTNHLVSYLSTLGVFALAVAAFAFGVHDSAMTLAAFSALCTFAGIQAPRSPLPAKLGPAASAVLPVAVALALGGAIAGCGATLPAVVGVGEIVVNATCAGADKLCELDDPSCGSGACRAFHDGCAVLAPSAPIELSCSAPPAAAAVGQ